MFRVCYHTTGYVALMLYFDTELFQSTAATKVRKQKVGLCKILIIGNQGVIM